MKSGTKFLVDSGSIVSLVPRYFSDSPSTKRKLEFTAANGTVIHIYGNRAFNLNLGLRRAFAWAFVIADVECAILGADFLTHYELSVDLKSRRLADTQASCCIEGVTQAAAVHSVAVASSQPPDSEALSSDFKELLKQFNDIFEPVTAPGTGPIAAVQRGHNRTPGVRSPSPVHGREASRRKAAFRPTATTRHYSTIQQPVGQSSPPHQKRNVLQDFRRR